MGTANGRKSIFITGAASGIGKATAKLFADRSWFVGLYDVNEEGLADVAREIGEENCIYAKLDVRNRADWTAAIHAFGKATDGRMTVLFNNAGVGRHGWFEEMSGEDNDWVVDVNVKGVINGVQAAMPLLIDTPGYGDLLVGTEQSFAAVVEEVDRRIHAHNTKRQPTSPSLSLDDEKVDLRQAGICCHNSSSSQVRAQLVVFVHHLPSKVRSLTKETACFTSPRGTRPAGLGGTS